MKLVFRAGDSIPINSVRTKSAYAIDLKKANIDSEY